ncbi:MAG: hypothetical protein HY695_29155 [Deltaproteobacteria bacterium]|nr:hypothetical protein [Deltaproteobacteria bacterium]
MNLSHRIIFVDGADRVMRMPNNRFEKLLSRCPTERVPQFAGQRIRVAEVIVSLENRRPVEIIRTCYFYLNFDRRGFADYETFMKHGALAIEAHMGSFWRFPEDTKKVIRAGHLFAARRRDHEAVWKPTPPLAGAICNAALDDPAYPRVRSFTCETI